MLISIIIPVYNEKNTILKLLDTVHSSPVWKVHEKEILVIDDFSNDGTRDILKKNGHLKYSIQNSTYMRRSLNEIRRRRHWSWKYWGF